MSDERSGGISRQFFSLREIAQTAKRENWPTGKALEESRKLLRRKRRTKRG